MNHWTTHYETVFYYMLTHLSKQNVIDKLILGLTK